MLQEQYGRKGRKFKHLSKEKRAQIEQLLKQKVPKTQIAKIIGISRSTLYNELKRGMVEQTDTNLKPYKRYFYDAGQRVYEQHRQNSRPSLKLVQAHEIIQYAEKQILEEKLSPDAVCGKARAEGTFAKTVCTKTLYNYIDMCLLKARNIDLPLWVKRKTKVQRVRQNRRVYGMSIEERPEEINSRKEFGHWEIDTVIGKKESSAVLLTLDERMTKQRHILKISSRSSAAVEEGIARLMQKYEESFSRVFKSITSDNRSEFSTLPSILPQTAIYFAHPYSSFERGTNEKQNSLLRRFFLREKVLSMFLMVLLSVSNFGSIIFPEKSSIIPPLLTSFLVSYLILQFRDVNIFIKIFQKTIAFKKKCAIIVFVDEKITWKTKSVIFIKNVFGGVAHLGERDIEWATLKRKRKFKGKNSRKANI